MFYWIDFIISTLSTVYFAIQWFVYTDHSLPDLDGKPEQQVEHDASFKMESIVSIVILCIVRLIHLYFAYVVTCYYISLNQSHYSKLAADIDEELNFAGYNEMEDDQEQFVIDSIDSRPTVAGTRRS
ncbi:hypothetical protein BDF20DRAFT_823192 [Mycotypha africana]|uniref:uncharacterized protein n=1 Tax=Mycotypha africana TaxID=64632 RepID=UPI002300840C|nr:uncharacterized protein BDF20DRAFT_823192 [Mycotypha africana]KAI8973547.1 hypothetical protein BDF20DRAFT_823192 [Mycotypha africana]